MGYVGVYNTTRGIFYYNQGPGIVLPHRYRFNTDVYENVLTKGYASDLMNKHPLNQQNEILTAKHALKPQLYHTFTQGQYSTLAWIYSYTMHALF